MVLIKAQEAILGLLFKYNWNYDEVMTALKKKIIISDDLNKVKEDVKDYLSSHTCVTVVDEEYPEICKTMVPAPLALEYDGDLDLLNDAGEYVYVDDDDLAQELIKEGLATIYTTSDNKLKYVKDDKSLVINKGLEKWECKEEFINHTANKIVISKDESCDYEFRVIYYTDVDVYVKCTSTPSKRNNLIKEGANLFDSIEDLKNKKEEN